MAHGGLALATSLAAAFNVLLLFAILVGRLGGFPTREFAVSLAKIGLASALMGIYLVWVRHLGDWSLGLHARNGLILCACIGGGLVVFSVAAYLLRCPELRSIINIVRTKLTRA
jgi:putative peptidoglycan lipid II flippase